ncbi:MAG: recombination protein RecR [Bacteroidales bacterium]|nr:recombination protein RecR [Candidatus Scybalousia scybalohippi]MCQ2327069.1 recombination mediator RecR [Bacteroidales bacterium]
MNYPSIYLENVINELSKLPGVGKRTALRFALHLLAEDEQETTRLAECLLNMKKEIKLCKHCYSISDNDVCEVCANEKRNHNIVCVVENIRDVMAIENTNQYQGVYHVLGGVISPVDGIGAKDIRMAELVERIAKENIEEIILALPTTMEGDTTCFYINKLVKDFNVKVSAIARGVAIGDNIEYADEITLGRSIANRMPFEKIYSR